MSRTLVLGGARSGKSAWAEARFDATDPVVYVATARGVDPAADPEWAQRIEGHRRRRPAGWTTLEAPADLAAVVRDEPRPLLVDDLATWVTGLLDDAGWARDAPGPARSRDTLVEAVAGRRGRLVLVSAEVGLGVVPATSAGRRFRDELGTVNAALAAVCDDVRLMVAGRSLPLT